MQLFEAVTGVRVFEPQCTVVSAEFYFETEMNTLRSINTILIKNLFKKVLSEDAKSFSYKNWKR